MMIFIFRILQTMNVFCIILPYADSMRLIDVNAPKKIDSVAKACAGLIRKNAKRKQKLYIEIINLK